MTPAETVKQYIKGLSKEQQIDYLVGMMVAEEWRTKIGKSSLSDQAVIFACRYLGAMGIALEVQPYATPEQRQAILDDTFDWMRLHFTEAHATLVKTFEEQRGARDGQAN